MHNEIESLFDLKNKVALVTGASSGLGYRFCQILSRAGAHVVALARRHEHLKSLKDDITQNGGECFVYPCDLTDKSQRDKTLNNILQTYKLDILINNAGMGGYTPIFDSSAKSNQEQKFAQILNLNVVILWEITRQVVEHMKNNNIMGSIINLGSINGDAVPTTLTGAYSSSKAAVLQLTKQLVGELSPFGIRINAISPGLVHTEMTKFGIKSMGEFFKTKIPLGFIPDPPELDGIILLLASNKASAYITGTNFVVDGGMSWGGYNN